MNKPKFNPNQPYEAATPEAEEKPKFQADQPYEAAPEAPKSKMGTIGQAAMDTLGAAGKTAGTLRAGTTGPLTGLILEALTGKKAFTGDEMANAFNPKNLQGFPDNAEMFKRTGVANPALSDAIPSMYAKPGSKHAWYQPEKGGMLDPTAAGALQLFSDPALWVGGGEAGAAKEILAAHAARNASVPMKALSMAAAPVKAVGNAAGTLTGAKLVAKLADASAAGLGKIPAVGPGLEFAARAVPNPIGKVVIEPVGKFAYGSPLLPVAQEGEKFGKRGITDDLYNAGIKLPTGLRAEVNKAASVLGQNKEALIQGSGGTAGSVERAVAPAREAIAKIRQVRNEQAQALADHLEGKLDDLVDSVHGAPAIPGTPATTKEVPRYIVDQDGFKTPISSEIVDVPGKPGTPAVPARPLTAQDADRLKSHAYMEQTTSSHIPGAPISGHEDVYNKAVGRGMKEETQNIVQDALGKGADLEDINRAYGGMKSTQTGQGVVSRQGDRNLHNVVAPTGVDAIIAAMGGGDHAKSMLGVLVNKLGYASRYGTMPAGYGLRRLSETNLVDRMTKPESSPWKLNYQGSVNEKK